MITTKKDLALLRQLASFKWRHGFVCRTKKCGSADCYWRDDWAAVCKKCKVVESSSAHTALEGLKMPISKAVDILLAVQYYYDYYQVPDEDSKNYSYDENVKVVPTRITIAELAKDFKMQPVSINKFFIRLHSHLGTEDFDYAPNSFQKGLKYESLPIYRTLFNLLFESYMGEWKMNSVKKILCMLAVKKLDLIEDAISQDDNSFIESIEWDEIPLLKRKK